MSSREPWTYREEGERASLFDPRQVSIWVISDANKNTVATVYSQADAERIVACVNVLQRMETHELAQAAKVIDEHWTHGVGYVLKVMEHDGGGRPRE